MNTTTHRTAIRFYAHLLKVIGFENNAWHGIVHHTDGSSRLWIGKDVCVIDRTPDEVFIDNGIDEENARFELVVMLKAAIAERGLESKN